MTGLIIIVLVFGITDFIHARETTTIETSVGTFKGYIRTQRAFGHEYRVKRFLGIPYAEPPLGELRFQKPQPKQKINEPYDATQFGASCLQLKIDPGGQRKPLAADIAHFSEDCLFLNIFVPDKPSVPETSLPVMINIHGGAFVEGSSSIHPGDILSAYGNVIVVTFNYRLSVWGFLSTGDENLPGNYGLWDQRLALQWVHDNIAAFGGDPDMVTLFGQSSGAASVVYQGLYPENSGLFKRIIAQSGSSTCQWAYNHSPLPTAKRIGKALGCKGESSTDLLNCLRMKSASEVNDMINDDKNMFIRDPMELIPVVDGDFVPESPDDIFHGKSEMALLYRATFKGFDFMTGVTSNEGLVALSPVGADHFEVDREKLENKFVPEAARVMFGNDVPKVVKNLIAAEYTEWSNPNDNLLSREAYLRLSGDYNVNVQTKQTLEVHAHDTNKNTFFYLLDASPSQHLVWTPKWARGANHADDLTFLFGYDSEDGFTAWTTPYEENLPEEWEFDMSKMFITLWANFARSGDPNKPVDVTHMINTTWPKYNQLTEQHLNISQEMSPASIGQRLFSRSYNFWTNILPDVIAATRCGDTKIHGNEQDFCEKEGDCGP